MTFHLKEDAIIKKVLFVEFELEIGGAEWVMVNLCNEFVRKGIQITMITSREGPLVSRLDKRVEILYIRGELLKRFFYLIRQLTLKRYHAVIATERWTSSILSLAHCVSRSKALMVIREAASNFAQSLEKTSRLKRILFKTLFVFAYRRADLLIANSEGTLNSLKKNNLLGPNKTIVMIDNPVDIVMVQARSLEQSSIAHRGRSGKIIVTIGRLDQQKRIQDVILAVDALRLRGRDVSLYILGEGPERNVLEQLIEQRNLNDVVTLTGKLENPYPILKAADVFVLASEFEGFGMVIVEALALGVPVVATDIPSGPQGILNHGQYGKLFRVGDIPKLVEHIESYLENRPEKEILIKRAMEFEKSINAKRYMRAMGLE
jgi:glycosyltransferase involved in cell wall biosynthesis